MCSRCMVSVYLSLGRLSELNLLNCFVVHGIAVLVYYYYYISIKLHQRTYCTCFSALWFMHGAAIAVAVLAELQHWQQPATDSYLSTPCEI